MERGKFSRACAVSFPPTSKGMLCKISGFQVRITHPNQLAVMEYLPLNREDKPRMGRPGSKLYTFAVRWMLFSGLIVIYVGWCQSLVFFSSSRNAVEKTRTSKPL